MTLDELIEKCRRNPHAVAVGVVGSLTLTAQQDAHGRVVLFHKGRKTSRARLRLQLKETKQ